MSLRIGSVTQIHRFFGLSLNYNLPLGSVAYHLQQRDAVKRSSGEWYDKMGTAILITHGSYSSTIIQDVTHHCQSNPPSAIAYFYFDFHDQTKQRYESLIRSLIIQLSDQSITTPEALNRLYSQYQGRYQLPATALVATLRDILRDVQHSYIVIDAHGER
jgi:hypothetical protein